MFYKHRVEAQKAEKLQAQKNLRSIYLEAYRYSLDLCENPEIAQKVASSFLESMGMKEQSSPVSDCGKPRLLISVPWPHFADRTVENH